MPGPPVCRGERRPGAAVAGLPDSTPVIVSGGDRTVRVWRLARRPISHDSKVAARPAGKPLTGHSERVLAVAVGELPDGTPVIVSGGGYSDGTVRVWRLADGASVGKPLHLSEPVEGIALHGGIIVTAVGRDIAVHQPAAP